MSPQQRTALDALIDGGLTVGEVLMIYGMRQRRDESQLDAYIDAATHADGELEVDDLAIVSPSDDAGAYVMSWQWVSDAAAGITRPDDAEAA